MSQLSQKKTAVAAGKKLDNYGIDSLIAAKTAAIATDCVDSLANFWPRISR